MMQGLFIPLSRGIFSFCAVIERRVVDYEIAQDSLVRNDDHADLLLVPLCQIGESIQSMRDELEDRFPEMPWHQMAGLRNVIPFP